MSEIYTMYGVDQEQRMAAELGYKLMYHDFGLGDFPQGWYLNKGIEYKYLGDTEEAKEIIKVMHQE